MSQDKPPDETQTEYPPDWLETLHAELAAAPPRRGWYDPDPDPDDSAFYWRPPHPASMFLPGPVCVTIEPPPVPAPLKKYKSRKALVCRPGKPATRKYSPHVQHVVWRLYRDENHLLAEIPIALDCYPLRHIYWNLHNQLLIQVETVHRLRAFVDYLQLTQKHIEVVNETCYVTYYENNPVPRFIQQRERRSWDNHGRYGPQDNPKSDRQYNGAYHGGWDNIIKASENI